MPSFFFHIAFDITKASSTGTCRLVSGADIFLPIKQASHQQAIDPEKETFQGSAATQDQAQRDRRKLASNQVELCRKTQVEAHLLPGNGKEGETDFKASTLVAYDWRYDNIAVQRVDMVPIGEGEKHVSINNGLGASPGGLATKGRYEPLDLEHDDIGWGIVRLYRDSEETPGLYDDVPFSKGSRGGRSSLRKGDGKAPIFRDEDCTTLCILAVPSYLTPSDFLGFVGEKTRDEVSHFRMIRTERGNRYMVLMKFRSGKRAREWRTEWDGKAFDGMEVGIGLSFEATCLC